MLKSRRFTALLGALLVVATVVAVLGLPFASFSLTQVSAQPDDEVTVCGGKPVYQVRFNKSEVGVYSSPELTNYLAIVPNAELQKYLLCDFVDTRADGYVAIFFPINRKLYVNTADVADITCRNDRDNEVGQCD